jgi:two-component system, OmpR family, heavy metal sensor histidine kinase CusS
VRLNIRRRLTLWNTLALAVVLTCFAALVYGLFGHALYEQTDRGLQAALGRLQADDRIEAATEQRLRYWIEEFKDRQNLFCVVYRADGALYARTAGMAEETVPRMPGGGQDYWEYDERSPAVGRQRVMAQRMRLGGRDFVVMLLAPLETVDDELEEFRSVLFTAGPLALLLSAGLAYWLARKALAPIDRLRRATDAVTADRLDQRLPVPNPHDELGLLTRTINAMIARLERSFAEIRRFTADASHELRTPLTALRAEVEVTLGKPLTLDNATQALGNILEELVRMSRLTDQLLTLSRRDAGVEQLTLTPLDLHSLAAGVVDTMQPLAEAKEVQLRLDGEDPVQVAGDEGRLRQVFINLLDNALKFTPERGRVTVRVERRGEAAVVAVEDTGIGIPPEHVPKVFDRFYRVDKARSREQGGTGLGLSISKSIVLAHGGGIELTSVPGHGTTCFVTLPLAAHEAYGRSEAE